MKLPPYNVFPTLRDSRIALREIRDSDLNDLVEISFYDAVQAKNYDDAALMQVKINDDYNRGNSIHWGISDIVSHQIVGTCGYYRGFEMGKGELGFVLLQQFRGNGYMTSAIKLAVEFGLKEIGLERIWAATNQNNSEAIQLLERTNFVRTADLNDGETEYEYKIP